MRRFGLPSKLLTVASLSLTLERGARADPAPDEVDARYAAITSALERGEGRAKLWWYGWTLGLGAITVGEMTAAIVTRDEGTRVDAVVSAGGSLLGTGAMLVVVSRSAFEFRDRLAAIDASTPDGRLARLHEAEKILDEAADDEIAGHSLLAHLASNAVTLAGTFVLWAGYHEYASGWLNLIGGTLTGEAQIFTKPRAAIEARRAYRAGAPQPVPPSSFSWTVIPGVGGVTLAGSF
jgi:hypothetical protein